MQLERIYTGVIEQSNAINAAADPEVNQRSMAGFYVDCLRAHALGHLVDFNAINAAILKRWPKGLVRIKTLAWRELTCAPKEGKKDATK